MLIFNCQLWIIILPHPLTGFYSLIFYTFNIKKQQDKVVNLNFISNLVFFSFVKVNFDFYLFKICFQILITISLQKGGIPAAPSGTATLLRLSPSHQSYPRPLLAVTDFRYSRLPWLDGRCVQGPGTYSPHHGWCAITSESSFVESSSRLQSELRPALKIGSPSQVSSSLYRPL